MPKTWTETHIHVSDQLQETIPDAQHSILCELALDSLNYPDAWIAADDRLRCSFLASDGSAVIVEIGVATIDSSLATIFSVHMKDASLADLTTPLKRIDEFEGDYVDTDYQSQPVSDRSVMKVRLGEVRPLQPMRVDPED